jgi:ATP-dependent DNA helicase DinG
METSPRHNGCVNQDYITQFFSKGGQLSKVFPGYQPRMQQIELAYAVDEAMNNSDYLLAEAPTGTGKSLGYGVPAAHFAGTRGQKVVIVTANIALQEQLVNKDLPLIQRTVPWKFEFALAKGINNYLCLSNFDEAMSEAAFEGSSADHRGHWNEISKWAASTLTGDLSELSFEAPPALRQKFTTTSDDCIGRKCSFYNQCFAMKAKSAYKRAQVVVTNYSLFFIDLALRGAEPGAEGILPKYTHVIFDEGHKAADIAREFFGFSLSPYGVHTVLNMLDSPAKETSKKGPFYTIDAELKKRGVRKSEEFFELLFKWYKSKEYNIRIRAPFTGRILELARDLQTVLGAASRAFNEASTDVRLNEVRKAETGNYAARCDKYSSSLGAMLIPTTFDSSEWVYYLEERGRSVSLNGKPVAVAEFLKKLLFKEGSDKTANDVKSVVVTSATLEMKLARKQLGLANPVELRVDSPFDLENQMLMVLPSMPDPSSPMFARKLGSRLIEVLNQSQGRALCLFTSYRVLEEAYAIVLAEGLPYTILKQGDAPRTQLIAQFKADTSSVLFGTESFWAGVDVPGEALSVVTIDRIPFPNVSDPVQDALKEKNQRSYFGEFSLPIAMLQFRQGAGRLIRAIDDRGVLVCFDPRLLEKPYGRQFVNVLTKSGVKTTRDIQEIGLFLGDPVT